MSSRLLALGSFLVLLVAWVILAIRFLSRPLGSRDRLIEAFDRAFVEVLNGR